MADMRALLAGLIDYRDSLARQVKSLEGDFVDVRRVWIVLDGSFAGNAADEFRPIWQAADDRFREYVERTTVILRVLSERIASLEEAERTVGLDN